MRVLYFADEYHREHGARTHARGFFKALSADPRVSYAEVFPPRPSWATGPAGPPATGVSGGAESAPPRRVQRAATGFLRRLPPRLAAEAQLFHPPASAYRAFSATLTAGRFDAAVLRLSYRFRYLAYLRRDHPHCLVCVEYNSTPFDERFSGVPGERWWRREEVRRLALADCISVVSQPLRDYLLAMDPSLEPRVFVNPNGADPEVFPIQPAAVRDAARRELGAPWDAFVVGYVGGFERWRRLPELVSWVGRARRYGLSRLYLVLIGAGQDLAALEALTAGEESGLAGHSFLSRTWVPAEQVPRLMAAFDCGLVSFQYRHACQQKVFEYLLSALPVVSPTGGVPSPLLTAEHGVYEFGADPEGLMTVLRRIHDDPGTARTAALRGRELVTARFTWQANAARIVDALDSRMKG